MTPTTESAHVDELRSTVEDLQTGLALLPRDQAVRRIDVWHDRLKASDRSDLQQIAAGLQDLGAHLRSDKLDAGVIGDALAELGRQTVAAGSHTTTNDDVRSTVERLGQLLLHSGHALRGPRPVSN